MSFAINNHGEVFMMKRTVFIILIVFLSVLSVAAHATPIGKFSSVSGRVDLTRPGLSARPVHTGDEVTVGDIIRAKSKSKAEIVFIDGSILRIAQKSRVKISDYTVGEGHKSGIFNLFRGKIENVVKKSGGLFGFKKKSKFEVHTATAICGVRGTDFFSIHQGSLSTFIFKEGTGYGYTKNRPDQIAEIKANQAMLIVNPDLPPIVRPAKPEEISRHSADTAPSEPDEGEKGKKDDARVSKGPDDKKGDDKSEDPEKGDEQSTGEKPGESDKKSGDDRAEERKPGDDKQSDRRPGDREPGDYKPGDDDRGDDRRGDRRRRYYARTDDRSRDDEGRDEEFRPDDRGDRRRGDERHDDYGPRDDRRDDRGPGDYGPRDDRRGDYGPGDYSPYGPPPPGEDYGPYGPPPPGGDYGTYGPPPPGDYGPYGPPPPGGDYGPYGPPPPGGDYGTYGPPPPGDYGPYGPPPPGDFYAGDFYMGDFGPGDFYGDDFYMGDFYGDDFYGGDFYGDDFWGPGDDFFFDPDMHMDIDNFLKLPFSVDSIRISGNSGDTKFSLSMSGYYEAPPPFMYMYENIRGALGGSLKSGYFYGFTNCEWMYGVTEVRGIGVFFYIDSGNDSGGMIVGELSGSYSAASPYDWSASGSLDWVQLGDPGTVTDPGSVEAITDYARDIELVSGSDTGDFDISRSRGIFDSIQETQYWGFWENGIGATYSTMVGNWSLEWEQQGTECDPPGAMNLRLYMSAKGTAGDKNIEGDIAGGWVDIEHAVTGIAVGDLHGGYNPSSGDIFAGSGGPWLETSDLLTMVAERPNDLVKMNIPCIEIGKATLSGSGGNITALTLTDVTFLAHSAGGTPRIWATDTVAGTY
ncbi:MAG: FecR domain-containing protein, partial [Thermodesulfobacteriota bacterium]|nr:FecR domain-containing protein [Thermodesulfobacteriota bacterium]